MRSRTRREDLPQEQVAFLDRLEVAVASVGGIQNATALIWGTDQPRGTLSKILTGDRAPGLFTIKKIADGLGTSVSYLLGENVQELTPEDRAHLQQLIAAAAQVDELRDWATVRLRPTGEGVRPSSERVSSSVTAITKDPLTGVIYTEPIERGTRPAPADLDVRPTTDLYGGLDAGRERRQQKGGRRKGDHGRDDTPDNSQE